MTKMELDELRHLVRSIVADPTLTYRQRVQALAGAAEEAVDPPQVSTACREALDKRIICDLAEGHAPYRPRYTAARLRTARCPRAASSSSWPTADDLRRGRHVPARACTGTSRPSPATPCGSVTSTHCSSRSPPTSTTTSCTPCSASCGSRSTGSLPDAFTHANLGPDDTRVARTILALQRELRQVVPNLTLRSIPSARPTTLLVDAVSTVVACGPSRTS
jgi:hypothetical protein